MKYCAFLYLLAGMLELVSELMGSVPLHYVAKPLLMPLLIAFFARTAGRSSGRAFWLMIGAFFFSWIGDVALMFNGFYFFLMGLGGFLITHILFICAFSMVSDRSVQPLLKRKPWLLLPLLVYLGCLLSLVFPPVAAAMKVPVGIYTAVLGLMLVFALNRFGRVNDSSFVFVFGGALLFMLSDSFLAVNKFLCHGTIYMAGIWIMSTYIAGQYLIAKGMALNETRDRSYRYF